MFADSSFGAWASWCPVRTWLTRVSSLLPHCPPPGGGGGPYSFAATFDSFARLHSILASPHDLAEFSLAFMSRNIRSLWYRVQWALANAWLCTPTTERKIPPPSKVPQAVPLSSTHLPTPAISDLFSVSTEFGFFQNGIKWNHPIYSFWGLASFSRQDAFKIHLCLCASPGFVPLLLLGNIPLNGYITITTSIVDPLTSWGPLSYFLLCHKHSVSYLKSSLSTSRSHKFPSRLSF